MAEYVAQLDGYGCAVASLAMIAGWSYAEMKAWLATRGLTAKRMEGGLHEGIWTEALNQLGFVYERRYAHDSLAGATRMPWPSAPFAPIHLCCVEVPSGESHAIVMLDDGRVLDPWDRSRDSLAHPDYRKVNQIVGVWRRPARNGVLESC